MTDTALVCTPEEFLAATPQKRAVYVRDQILLTPELYDQTTWAYDGECGTVCCVAGWACQLAGDRFCFPNKVGVYGRAIHEFVLDEVDVQWHVMRRAAHLLDIARDDDPVWHLRDDDDPDYSDDTELFDPDVSQDVVMRALEELAAR